MTPLQTAFNFIYDIELEGLINNGWTETLGECSGIDLLKNDKFNASIIHWLPDFKTGYSKILSLRNNIFDSTYSLTDNQVEYNQRYTEGLGSTFTKEFGVGADYDSNEYIEFISDSSHNDNAEFAFLKLEVYITKKDTIVFLLTLNYSFLEDHAYLYDETLSKVEYSLDEIDNIVLEELEKLLRNY